MTALAIRHLAEVLDARGRTAQAEILYRKCLELLTAAGVAPGTNAILETRVKLGASLVRQERWEEAYSLFKAVASSIASSKVSSM